MADEQLQFQDFGSDAKVSEVTSKRDAEGTTYEFEHSGNIGEKLLDENQKPGDFGTSAGGPSFWTFEYYQQFFDVDTDQVVNRLVNSFVPRIGGNFITQHVRPLPDLYGPFWIGVTLVFVTGIFGNLAQYVQTLGANTTEHYYWRHDFRIVTAAGTAIFTYVCIVPLLLYAFLWYRRSEVGYSYLEILSAYGYSLAIFVPVSMLWVINYDIFRWVLIGVAVFLSGSVLLFTFWPAVKHDQKLIAVLTMVLILGLHMLLAAGFKHYFFHSAHGVQLGDKLQVGQSVSVVPSPSTKPPAQLKTLLSVKPEVVPPKAGKAAPTNTPEKQKETANKPEVKSEGDKKQEARRSLTEKKPRRKHPKKQKSPEKEVQTKATGTVSVKSVKPALSRKRR